MSEAEDKHVYVETNDRALFRVPESMANKSRLLSQLLSERQTEQDNVPLPISSISMQWIMEYWNTVTYRETDPLIRIEGECKSSQLTSSERRFVHMIRDKHPMDATFKQLQRDVDKMAVAITKEQHECALKERDRLQSERLSLLLEVALVEVCRQDGHTPNAQTILAASGVTPTLTSTVSSKQKTRRKVSSKETEQTPDSKRKRS